MGRQGWLVGRAGGHYCQDGVLLPRLRIPWCGWSLGQYLERLLSRANCQTKTGAAELLFWLKGCTQENDKPVNIIQAELKPLTRMGKATWGP